MLWNSSLECGIEVIDHEHRQMVEHVEQLLNEPDPDRVREMLTFLKEYVVKHFAHEQLMHKQCEYAFAAEHKAAHLEFVHTFMQLEEEYLELGYSQELLQKITTVLNDWLAEHIMGEDMKFTNFYKTLDVRERPTVTSIWRKADAEYRRL